MMLIRNVGSPMSSPALPAIPLAKSKNCCRGTGETRTPTSNRSPDNMHVNKVSHVFTINYVAELLGKTEEAIADIAETMDPEDGYLWGVGVGEHGVRAFTKFGIENLREHFDNAEK